MTRLDYSTRTWVPIFMWVPIFIWVLIHGKHLHAGEVGAYIHGVLILYGCLLSRVYGNTTILHQDQHPKSLVQLRTCTVVAVNCEM